MKATARRKRPAAKAPYHHGALREALVEAAARLAAERGLAAFSLREAARRAGVSQAAPYHYFPNKAALLAAVAEEGFRVFEAKQAAAIHQASATPGDQLQALGAAYVQFAIDKPHYFRLMFRTHLVDHARYPTLHDASRRAFDRLVETTRAARLAEGHDDPDPLLAATLIWSVPHGLAALYLDGPLSATTAPQALEALARAAMAPLVAAPLAQMQQADAPWGV